VKVPSSDDVGEELTRGRVASKDQSVGIVGVKCAQPVRLDRSEAVSDMNDLVVGTDFVNLTITDLGGDFVQSLNFSLGLDLVERIAMRRVANAQTVDCQSTVACGKSSVDVAVVVVVVAQIPVAAGVVRFLDVSLGISGKTHVLSNPIPCVSSWIVSLLPLSGLQYCAEIL
jgi:hypothetical protein